MIAESELEQTNLTGRIEAFREMRNTQRKWIAKYEKEFRDLESDVMNVRSISEALPAECYNQNRLEP